MFLDAFTNAKIEGMSLEVAMHKLRRWRNVLQNVLARHSTSSTPLFKVAPLLAAVRASPCGPCCINMQVPGQYQRSAMDFSPIHPQHHSTIVRFGSNVKVTIGEKVIKRITIMSSEGKCSVWRLENNENRTRDDRISHLTRVMNSMLLTHPQSRRRNVGIKQPIAIPLSPTLRLVEEDLQFTTLQNVYDEYCHEVGMESDIAILAYHRQLSLIEKRKAKNELEASKVIEEKVRGYREMCAKTPDSILANYVHASLNGDAESLWSLKRTIATRIATCSLLEHALIIRQRSPQNLQFHRKTGAVMSGNFRPSYNSFGALVVGFEEVPFRLTRNLTTLLSPLLVDGVFACSMGVTALALNSNKNKLSSYLALILRDDLVASTMNTSSGNNMKCTNDLEQREVERAQEPFINRNVNTVCELLHTAAPRALMDQSGERVLREHRVDHIVHRLIEAAAQPERLCMMSPSLMPWL
jgi:transformation/transcription domain-associated protein